MNKIRTFMLAIVVGLGGLAMLALSSPAGAATTQCTGWANTAISGAIVVPDGATCWVRNTDSVTDVTVNPKGTLVLYFAKVDSVNAYGAVQSWASTVRNTTVLTGVSNGPSVFCGSTLGGLTLQRVVSPVDIRPMDGSFCTSSNSIAGNLKMEGNTGRITVNATSVTDYCFGAGNTPAPIILALTTLDGERRGDCAPR